MAVEMWQITSLCKIPPVALWKLRGGQGEYEGGARYRHDESWFSWKGLKQAPEATTVSTYCDDGFFVCGSTLPSTREGESPSKPHVPNKNLGRASPAAVTSTSVWGALRHDLRRGSSAQMYYGFQASLERHERPGTGRGEGL